MPQYKGRKKIGEILIAMGRVSEMAVHNILQEQQKTKAEKGYQIRLGDLLLKKKLVSEHDLAESVAVQYNTDYVDLRGVRIAPELLERVPLKLLSEYNFVPIKLEPKRLTIASEDDIPEELFSKLFALFRVEIRFVSATRSQISQAKNACIQAISQIEQSGRRDHLELSSVLGPAPTADPSQPLLGADPDLPGAAAPPFAGAAALAPVGPSGLAAASPAYGGGGREQDTAGGLAAEMHAQQEPTSGRPAPLQGGAAPASRPLPSQPLQPPLQPQGYPPQPAAQPAYPQQPPPQQPGYPQHPPPPQAGYPPAQPGYPGQPPPQPAGYPPQPPAQAPGYPQQPPPPQAGFPQHPPSHPGYPPQQPAPPLGETGFGEPGFGDPLPAAPRPVFSPAGPPASGSAEPLGESGFGDALPQGRPVFSPQPGPAPTFEEPETPTQAPGRPLASDAPPRPAPAEVAAVPAPPARPGPASTPGPQPAVAPSPPSQPTRRPSHPPAAPAAVFEATPGSRTESSGVIDPARLPPELREALEWAVTESWPTITFLPEGSKAQIVGRRGTRQAVLADLPGPVYGQLIQSLGSMLGFSPGALAQPLRKVFTIELGEAGAGNFTFTVTPSRPPLVQVILRTEPWTRGLGAIGYPPAVPMPGPLLAGGQGLVILAAPDAQSVRPVYEATLAEAGFSDAVGLALETQPGTRVPGVLRIQAGVGQGDCPALSPGALADFVEGGTRLLAVDTEPSPADLKRLVHLALTEAGVLVPTTAGDALNAFMRVKKCGVSTSALVEATRLILVAHPVGRICPYCKETYLVTEDRLPEEHRASLANVKVYRGKGCAACEGSGIQGITYLFETLELPPGRVDVDRLTREKKPLRTFLLEEELLIPLHLHARKALMWGLVGIEDYLARCKKS